MPVRSSFLTRDDLRDQYLHYYYYMTGYNLALNRSQQIKVYIAPNDETSIPRLIDTVTNMDMTINRWENRSVYFNSSTGTYDVR
jgi:hypothetical protein